MDKVSGNCKGSTPPGILNSKPGKIKLITDLSRIFDDQERPKYRQRGQAISRFIRSVTSDSILLLVHRAFP